MSVAENAGMLPMTRGGNDEAARFNALRHGVLSGYIVLPWEDAQATSRCSKRSSPNTSRRGRRRSTSSRSWRA